MFKFLVGFSFISAALLASDLSLKNTDELLNMRGTLATQQERNALHNELKIRKHTMTQEQKKSLMKDPPMQDKVVAWDKIVVAVAEEGNNASKSCIIKRKGELWKKSKNFLSL